MSAAIISDCGLYRYSLSRDKGPLLPSDGTVAFIMINPSTADATEDDPTIRKCRGFADRWGFDRFTVGNLYAYRATDPSHLLDAAHAGIDPVGPDNDDHLRTQVIMANSVVFAWGGTADRARKAGLKVDERIGWLADLCRTVGNWPDALGFTKSGQPRHPLMLPYATRRGLWMPAEEAVQDAAYDAEANAMGIK